MIEDNEQVCKLEITESVVSDLDKKATDDSIGTRVQWR